jgi:hypothetical protein
VPIAVVGLLLAVLLQERPLRTSAAGAAPAPAQEPEPGPAVGVPSGR